MGYDSMEEWVLIQYPKVYDELSLDRLKPCTTQRGLQAVFTKYCEENTIEAPLNGEPWVDILDRVDKELYKRDKDET